ncbi:hypothetical protein KM043_015449 [Ampulex compressa]|nr:hypothetical protein KM043_015449 [Ampulex compressa]
MLRTGEDSDISDYFRSNLLTLRKAILPQEFKRFAALNSNKERVAFVLKYPEAHSLSLEVENVEHKDAQKALQLKDTGNKFFGHSKFLKALETYSNAVLVAPWEELGVILANRSAALLHLERYAHALEDAEEALRVGYPPELAYKLEERRARCLLALKAPGKAVQAFRCALQALDHAKLSLEKKQKLEMDMRVMMAVMEKGKSLAQSANKSARQTATTDTAVVPLVPRIEERNALYPACSKAVEIKDQGGDVGRHAVATRNIEPGETLVVEEPHCAFLLAEYRLTHCHQCFVRIFAPIPAACRSCTHLAYCSVRCRNLHAKVHLRECKLLSALWLSKASVTCFMALKAIIQRPFEEIIKLKDKLGASKGKLEITAQRPYRGCHYETLYGLVTHEDRRSTEDIFHRAYIASWLLRLLKTGDYIPECSRTPDLPGQSLSDDELFIGELLLHNLQLLQFNPHEISELTKPGSDKTLSRSKSIFIGGGVYPTVAMFNHSCNPSVVRYFVGTTMVLRAVRTIAAGEEISENYGPIFTTTPMAERKRKMRMQYWFDCNCEACAGNWPLLEDIDPTILRFKCETGSACGNVLPVKTDTNEFMIRCPKCGKSTNILKGLKALQDTDALFKVATQNLQEGQHENALKSYLEILKLLDETLALPIRDYHLCQQGVRLCMLTLGNTTLV